MNPIVSIIIPVYDQVKELEFLLYSIRMQNFEEDFEVIICDGGSNENIKSIINNPFINFPIKYFQQEHQGFGLAKLKNIGVLNAQGEILVFINSNVVLNKNFIKEHYKVHKKSKKNLIVIGIQFVYYNNIKKRCLINWEKYLKRQKAIILDKRFEVLKNYIKSFHEFSYPFIMCRMCNLSVNKKSVFESGLFDESFIGYVSEDIELAYRLQKNDLYFTIVKKAICYQKYTQLSLEQHIAIQRDELNIYNKYKNSHLAEGLILSGNKLVYNEYKKDLMAIINHVDKHARIYLRRKKND